MPDNQDQENQKPLAQPQDQQKVDQTQKPELDQEKPGAGKEDLGKGDKPQ